MKYKRYYIDKIYEVKRCSDLECLIHTNTLEEAKKVIDDEIVSIRINKKVEELKKRDVWNG